jgi:hypothetical protein
LGVSGLGLKPFNLQNQTGATAMTEKLSQLEYAKQYAPASRIPESFLTMGDVVEMLERIEELKADLANANEGARLMHSVATGGESKLLESWKDEAIAQESDAKDWQKQVSELRG